MASRVETRNTLGPVPNKRAALVWVATIVFALNTAYLAAFASASLFYFVNVVLHMALGLGLAVVLLPALGRTWRETGLFLRVAAAVTALGALTGIAIMIVGAASPFPPLLPIHIALSLTPAVPLLTYYARPR